MQDIYTQLFNSYAHDVQRHLKMAEARSKTVSLNFIKI